MASTPVDGYHILFIDAFDSFSNNVIGLLEGNLQARVTTVHLDDEDLKTDLEATLEKYDAVVVGPGPGHPANPQDIGFVEKLWQLDKEHQIPVLGVCLGFQSLCHVHGAKVKRLQQPRHGIVSRARHADKDIFTGTGNCDMTQYHSLQADLGIESQGNEDDPKLWQPSEKCPKLLPLAWDFSDTENGPILMGVRHLEKPFWGVQFHPESICSSEAGRILVENWWWNAKQWLAKSKPASLQRRCSSVAFELKSPTAHAYDEELRGMRHSPVQSESGTDITSSTSDRDLTDTASSVSNHALADSHLIEELRQIVGGDKVFLRWGQNRGANISAPDLVELLEHSRDEIVLLDSQAHPSGRYSILGLIVPGKTLKVTYNAWSKTLRYGVRPNQMYTTEIDDIDQVWPFLQEVLDLHRPHNMRLGGRNPVANGVIGGLDSCVADDLPKSPFWGGFMGYISYEAGLQTIDVELDPSSKANDDSDINFAFIHRSVVIDHETSQVYVQSLLPEDWSWIFRTGAAVDRLATRAEMAAMGQAKVTQAIPPTVAIDNGNLLDSKLSRMDVRCPNEADYRAKVLHCQGYLRSGDSYELCLTDETQIDMPVDGSAGVDEWSLYKRLRAKNPAPFGAFIRLAGSEVVGTSPERFLQWTREGGCQFRPIKGTVKKGPHMTRDRAHAILGTSKERAENLMIVDLIRHDLAGVVGAQNTHVSKLMVVEEYETVYQLVSVIECPPGSLQRRGVGATGIDVLKSSLPPGSMTGAPKKRSCEILRDIEKRPRGLYAGVLGYMDVGGGGDFSVVIRTMFRDGKGGPLDKETGPNVNAQAMETWRLGAGGAVTIQSTDEGEYLEMETKASSVLGGLKPEQSRMATSE